MSRFILMFWGTYLYTCAHPLFENQFCLIQRKWVARQQLWLIFTFCQLTISRTLWVHDNRKWTRHIKKHLRLKLWNVLYPWASAASTWKRRREMRVFVLSVRSVDMIHVFRSCPSSKLLLKVYKVHLKCTATITHKSPQGD